MLRSAALDKERFVSWIRRIPPGEATGKLADLYKRIGGAGGQVDNILTAHSLRPHTLEGHMALYKAVLHHFGNKVDKRILELVGVAVSLVNGCAYCVEHHFTGFRRLLGDDDKAAAIRGALEAGVPEREVDARTAAALRYAEKLARTPGAMAEADILALRDAGYDDGEILEINQVAAYFAYANRTVLGLGVSLAGEELGLSPSASDSPGNWQHR